VTKLGELDQKKAIELVKKYKNIETIIENLDQTKYPIPDGWMYSQARHLFKQPEVASAADIDLKWEKPDEEGLISFMCGEKGFAEDRIRNGAKKLQKARSGTTQGRLDSFFKVLPSPTAGQNKRKVEDNKGSAKKTRGGSAAAKKGAFRR